MAHLAARLGRRVLAALAEANHLRKAGLARMLAAVGVRKRGRLRGLPRVRPGLAPARPVRRAHAQRRPHTRLVMRLAHRVHAGEDAAIAQARLQLVRNRQKTPLAPAISFLAPHTHQGLGVATRMVALLNRSCGGGCAEVERGGQKTAPSVPRVPHCHPEREGDQQRSRTSSAVVMASKYPPPSPSAISPQGASGSADVRGNYSGRGAPV